MLNNSVNDWILLDTFVYSVQPYNQFNGSPPPLFDNKTASPLFDLGLTYNASYGSGNGLSNTIGTSLLSNVAIDGSDLAVTNLTFADLYQTTNGVGASGLLGLGFPLNGNIWSVSKLLSRNEIRSKEIHCGLTCKGILIWFTWICIGNSTGRSNGNLSTNTENSFPSRIILFFPNSSIITSSKSNFTINV